MYERGSIYGSIPVRPNPSHPVNFGLRAWYLAGVPVDGGTRWYDLTAKYPATLTGFTSQAWAGSTRRFGRLLLDGSASYVPLPAATGVLTTKVLTYSCWIATTSTTLNTVFFSEGISSNTTTFLVLRQDTVNAALPGFSMRDDGAVSFSIVGTKTINDGLWHHIALSWGAGTAGLYVDGVLDGTVNAASAQNFTVNQVAVGCLSRTTNANFWAGSIDDVRIYSRALIGAEVAALYREGLAGYPDALHYWQPSPLILKPSAVTNYTLTAASGSFALAGSSAGLKTARRLTATPGTFAVVGQPVTLSSSGKVDYFKPRPWFGAWWSGRWTNRTGVAGYRLVAGTGSFTVAGSTAGLIATRKLAASAGAFTVTASASTGVSGHRLIAATGSFTITASNAGEVIGRRLIAAPGSFSIAASASTGIFARKITATPGAFTVTASAAGLVAGHRLTSAAGSFVVTASASSGTFTRRLTAATGTFILAGQPAALLHGIPGNFRLVALTGSFSVAGSPAGSAFTRRLTASSGSFAVTGQPSTGISTRRLLAAAGSFTVTGSASSEVTGRRLTAGVGSFVVTASPSGEIIGRRLVAATGSFTVAGASIGTGTGRRMVVAPGSFVITAAPAGLVATRRLVAATGTFIVTGYPAWLRRSGQAGAYPDPFSATSTSRLDPFAAVSITTLDPFAATSRLLGS